MRYRFCAPRQIRFWDARLHIQYVCSAAAVSIIVPIINLWSPSANCADAQMGLLRVIAAHKLFVPTTTTTAPECVFVCLLDVVCPARCKKKTHQTRRSREETVNLIRRLVRARVRMFSPSRARGLPVARDKRFPRAPFSTTGTIGRQSGSRSNCLIYNRTMRGKRLTPPGKKTNIQNLVNFVIHNSIRHDAGSGLTFATTRASFGCLQSNFHNLFMPIWSIYLS